MRVVRSSIRTKDFPKTTPKVPRRRCIFFFISRINLNRAPTLCLLERNAAWHIVSLTAIHSSFLVPWAIERRQPLREGARRAGWIGCNIRLDRIPPDGEVPLIKDGAELPKAEVRRRFQRYLPLATLSNEQRGWAALTLKFVRDLAKPEFTLSEIYAKEGRSSSRIPAQPSCPREDQAAATGSSRS